jgi:hypothetical protein
MWLLRDASPDARSYSVPRFVAGLIVCLMIFLVGCSQDHEVPGNASQQEDADACLVPSETSAIAAEPSAAGHESAPYPQSPEEALAQDLALVAEAQGWSLEQAETHYRASEALDPITSRLAAERPDAFIGSALPEDPGRPPKVYIKGPADESVRNMVAAAEVEIDIVDNQPYSRAELNHRQTRVLDAVREIGFAKISAGFDITNGGQMEVDVVRQAGLPDDPQEILAALPPEVRESVTLTFSDAPVDSCGD